jgi:hypothetical protein
MLYSLMETFTMVSIIANITNLLTLANPLNTFIFVVGLFALIIGSVTDIQKREVADWLNYGLMFTGIGIALIFSVVFKDITFIISSLLGLAIMFGLGCAMFYTGQWGGGDSKMIMGLGALLGLPLAFPLSKTLDLWIYHGSLPILVVFIIYALIVGGVYGLIWSLVLAFVNRREFIKDFRQRLSAPYYHYVHIVLIALFISSVIALFAFDILILKFILLWATLVIAILFYTFNFVKSIEACCMIKHVEPEELTEGEWINKDIFVSKGNSKNAKKEYIAGPKDLGISKEQIARLIKLKKDGKYKEKVEIKIGIPFVPSFLIAYLLSYFVGLTWLRGLFL